MFNFNTEKTNTQLDGVSIEAFLQSFDITPLPKFDTPLKDREFSFFNGNALECELPQLLAYTSVKKQETEHTAEQTDASFDVEEFLGSSSNDDSEGPMRSNSLESIQSSSSQSSLYTQEIQRQLEEVQKMDLNDCVDEIIDLVSVKRGARRADRAERKRAKRAAKREQMLKEQQLSRKQRCKKNLS